MHYPLFITCDKKHGTSSREIREYAYAKILHKELLIDADSFTIGGRYSGELSRTTWAKHVVKEIQKKEKRERILISGAAYPSIEDEEKQTRLRREAEALYQQAMPEHFKGSRLKYDRLLFESLEMPDFGYDDDAMTVTKELYNTYLQEFEGLAYKINKESETLRFVDLDGNKVDRSFLGTKWLLLGDYHM